MVLRIQSSYWPLSLVVLVMLTAVWVAFSIPTSGQPSYLAHAVTADLAITAPLLYLFLIRKTTIPKLTVLPCFFLGLLIAHSVLPAGERSFLSFLTNYAVPLIELTVFFFISRKAFHFIKTFRQQGKSQYDPLEVLVKSVQEILGEGRVSRIFATEMSVLYFSLLSWKTPAKQSAAHFTHYQKSGLGALVGIIVLILATETFALHILLLKWSGIVAWLASLSSVYLGLLFFAHYKASWQRQSWIDEKTLHLRYGLMGDANIPLEQIKEIVLSQRTPSVEEGYAKLGHAFENHNVILHLEQAISIRRMYGKEEEATILSLTIDDPEKLQELLVSYSRLNDLS